jgi:hypothetical protein
VEGIGWAAILGWRPRTSEYSHNARTHWATRARAAALARELTREALGSWPRGWAVGGERPVVRLAMGCRAGRLPDGDNLQTALKSVRDEVCAVLGVDDSDGACGFEYSAYRHKEDCVEILAVVGDGVGDRYGGLWGPGLLQFPGVRARAG